MYATTITFAGNLTADPQLRTTNGGHSLVEARVLVNRRLARRTETGLEPVEGEPTGWNITIWGDPAENFAASLRKGDRVLVVGQVHTEAWTDSETGEKRTKQVVNVEEIGTSLAWATAKPTKTPRQQNVSGGGDQQ